MIRAQVLFSTLQGSRALLKQLPVCVCVCVDVELWLGNAVCVRKTAAGSPIV